MNRTVRLAIATILLSLLFTAPSFGQLLYGAPVGSTRLSQHQFRGSGRVASLENQLKAGLKARRDVEFKFIANVVKLVKEGKLPVKLVVETMQYARKKPTRHPFQYFQRALALRAAKLGVKLTIV